MCYYPTCSLHRLYHVPARRFGWPDQFWECEREAAERAEGEVALKVAQAAARAATQADARAEAMSAGEAARELEAAGRSHPSSHAHETRHGHGNKPPHHQRGGPGDGRLGVPLHVRVLPTARRIFDLKEIAAAPGPAEMRGALRVARPEAFRECHMLRRELYGLPGGDGVHWGPAVHDAWLQLVLNAFCSPGTAAPPP